jgi:hypothetical protein
MAHIHGRVVDILAGYSCLELRVDRIGWHAGDRAW